MLPRCEMFKEVIFVPRLIAFNLSFVSVGKHKKTNPTAVIWHEAISGRMKEDMISAYYAFFLQQRDYNIMAGQLFSTEQKLGHILFFLFTLLTVQKLA